LGFGARLEIQFASWGKHLVRLVGAKQTALRLENRIAFLQQDPYVLRGELATYQEIVRLAPVGIYTLNGKGQILEINQQVCDIFGYTKDEMVGKEIFEFLVPEQRENARQRFFARIAGQPMPEKKGDRIYLAKDGRRIHAITFNTDLKNPDKVVTCFLDVSRLREVEEALKNARQAMIHQERAAAIGEVTAGMSHALKNLLAGAGGNVEMLKQNLMEATAALIILSTLDEEEAGNLREKADELLYEVRRLLCLLQKTIEGMGRTTRTMLEFARHGNEQKITLRIKNAVTEIVNDLQGLAAANKVRLSLDLKEIDELDAVFISEVAFMNIVRNLVVNAIQSFDSPNKIDSQVTLVVFKTQDNRLMMVVRDNGKGMSAQRVAELLRPNPIPIISYKPGGTGVGFLTVRQAVSSADGEIKVYSTEGRGTSVIVKLNLHRVAVIEDPEQVSATREIKVRRIPLLIVDDEPNIASFLEQLASSMGFQVFVFNDPEACLSAYHQMKIKPQIIIADFNMPQMSGVELLEAIKRSGAKTMPCTILVSGNSLRPADLDKVRAIIGKDLVVLEKPVPMQKLKDRLADFARLVAGDAAVTITDPQANEPTAIAACRQIAEKLFSSIGEIVSWHELDTPDMFRDEKEAAIEGFFAVVESVKCYAAGDLVSGVKPEDAKIIKTIARILLNNGLLVLNDWFVCNRSQINPAGLEAQTKKLLKILQALQNLYETKNLLAERWRAVFKQLMQ